MITHQRSAAIAIVMTAMAKIGVHERSAGLEEGGEHLERIHRFPPVCTRSGSMIRTRTVTGDESAAVKSSLRYGRVLRRVLERDLRARMDEQDAWRLGLWALVRRRRQRERPAAGRTAHGFMVHRRARARFGAAAAAGAA
jgi:hypothetical protein